MLVVLPTGFGKSLIYQALPSVFECRGKQRPIVVVVSPLVASMQDQVRSLVEHSLSAALVGQTDQNILSEIVASNVSVMIASPEAILGDKWRRVLVTAVWREKIVAVA